MSEEFDVLSFPFSGIRLIEASAGTGKTYSVSNLYIRLLVGHGDKHSAFKQPLSVDKILVLTFTRAATAELRERIYQRINQAIDAYNTQNQQSIQDTFLQQLVKDTADKESAINRLYYAATLIDQASIFTIHSFCQRIIQDNSFALQQDANMQFEIDTATHIKQVFLDVWRELNHSDKPRFQTALIRHQWPNFNTFSQQFTRFLSTHLYTNIYNQLVNLDTAFDAIFSTSYYDYLEQFKQDWLNSIEETRAFFAQTNIKNSHHYTSRIDKLVDFCNKPFSYEFPHVSFNKETVPVIACFTPHAIATQTAQSNHVKKPLLGNFSFANAAQWIIDNAPTTDTIKLQQWVLLQLRKRWQTYKQQHNLLFPDDILYRLSSALTNNADLATKLRTQYPVAMIDEFQDTDQAQYTIFRSLYQHQTDSCLSLIGDPKQAIYKFRGADLYTYINAKRAIDDTHRYHMQYNWRSSSNLVNACNHIFSQQQQPFLDTDIPFLAINAMADSIAEHPLSGITEKNGADTSGINFHFIQAKHDDKPCMTTAEAKQLLFHNCTQKIVQLLTGKSHVNRRIVHSHDICILTRSRADAKKIKQDLFAHGIASVFLDKNSVFESDCAIELTYLLHAILNPYQQSAIKTALSTHFYQYSYRDLLEKENDDMFWQRISKQLLNWQTHWRHYGLLSALNHWAHEEKIFIKLRALENGLRWITDFQHLAQLLQEASCQFDDLQQLYEYLQQQIQLAQDDEQPAGDSQQLRLDNDESLIRIVTVHSSKGLEFPIVFYPYACQASNSKGQDLIIHQLNQQQQYEQVIDFDPDDENKHQLAQASLAEDIRLLYVALTRAKYACFVGLANYGRVNKSLFTNSALASLLGLQQQPNLTHDILEQQLLILAQHASISYECISPQNLSTAADNECHHNAKAAINVQKTNIKLIPPRTIPTIKQAWFVSSYSQLIAQASHQSNASIEPEDKGRDEQWSTLVSVTQSPTFNQFSFPKGAQIGQFLHSLLENLVFDAQYNDIPVELIHTQLALYGLHYLTKDWTTVLQQWIGAILSHPLKPQDNQQAFSLSNISASSMQAEIHFYFSIDTRIAAQDIFNTLKQYNYLPSLTSLHQIQLQGLMTGFIDLLFKHENKYYIADYKSNFLGNTNEDYTHDKLQMSIDQHHYDLQYILYTLALHRLLKQQLQQEYDYATHIGGCLYLFLRGMDGISTNQGVFFDKPPQQLIEDLDQLIRSGSTI